MKLHNYIKSWLLASVLLTSPALFAQPVQEKTLNHLIDRSNLNTMILSSSHAIRPLFDSQRQEILKANLDVVTLNGEQKQPPFKLARCSKSPMNQL